MIWVLIKFVFSAHTFQITDNHLTTHGKLSSEKQFGVIFAVGHRASKRRRTDGASTSETQSFWRHVPAG